MKRTYAQFRVVFTVALAALAASAFGCSRGSLPGSPSPLGPVGGGARYDGTLTYTRLSGGFQIDTGTRRLDLSIVLGTGDELSGHFQAGDTNGSLQALLDGTMSAGRFEGTILVTTPASAGSTSAVCEGAGRVSGDFSGRTVAWRASDIAYDNCPGLVVGSQAQGTATSPVPGTVNGRANVVVTVRPSTRVHAGVCPSGTSGWPFTVIVAENAGVSLTLDDTFIVEERPTAGSSTRTIVDTPFRPLAGGARREYEVCARSPGTYQAFFAGNDSRGNRVRFASPVVTLLP
jgi:hypothetical protein